MLGGHKLSLERHFGYRAVYHHYKAGEGMLRWLWGRILSLGGYPGFTLSVGLRLMQNDEIKEYLHMVL